MKRLIFLVWGFVVIFLISDVISAQEAKDVKTGTISGQIMIKGDGPMAGGRVFFFKDSSGPPPSREKYWRIPDYMTDIDNRGKFSVELPEGKYYMGAIKKVSEKKNIGPPDEGDLFFAGTNGKGMPKAYIIKQGEKTDVGVIAEAAPFKRSVVKFDDGITAIEGMVIDKGAKPVEGALVFAFLSPSMVGRPLFASERTGKDGKYILRVHEGGKYYLRVRSVYGGGPPKEGEMIGDYDQKEPIIADVKTGEKLQGVNIKIKRFQGRGAKAPGK